MTAELGTDGGTHARITLISTGGTIEMVSANGRLDLADYPEHSKRLEGADLLARLPEAGTLAEIAVTEFGHLRNVDPGQWLDLHRITSHLLNEAAFDGAVITHGTNTLEETAFFLHLTLRTEKPVVVVGALRPASGISSDVDLNLLNAIRAAASPLLRGLGVVVVLNDAIHSARDVTKSSAYRLEAFQSRELGPLGYVDADGHVLIERRPTRLHTLSSRVDVSAAELLPRVDIVVSYAGNDGSAIEAAVHAGARGIVLAGSGAGGRTGEEELALDEARRTGVVVVISSRVLAGRVISTPGIRHSGFVAAGSLTPWKARILLMLALLRTSDSTEVQRLFDDH